MKKLLVVVLVAASLGLVAGAFAKNKPVVSKFEQVGEPFDLTAPSDYEHKNLLKNLFKKYERDSVVCAHSVNFSDKEFSLVTTKIRPGQKYVVTTYTVKVGSSVSSEEILAFLENKKGVLVGAQGLALVFEQKRYKQLIPDFFYYSFDRKDRLPILFYAWKAVPGLIAFSDSLGKRDFVFECHPFEKDWSNGEMFFCFRPR